MPPKAMNKNDVDELLANLMPDSLTKKSKLALINDTTLQATNVSFQHNYTKLLETAATIDISGDYALMSLYALQCTKALKNVFK